MSDVSPVQGDSRSDAKKALQLRYSHNYNTELSRLPGTFSFFYSNNRLYRALWNLYQAVLHVEKDPQRRVFTVGGRADEEAWLKFTRIAEEFKSLYGIAPGPEDVISSYLDLKPREKPDFARHVVTIPKPVHFYIAWHKCDREHIKNVAGFVKRVDIVNPYGVVIGQQEVESIPWDDIPQLIMF